MSLILNSENNLNVNDKFYSSKDFPPKTYSKVILNSKINQKSRFERSEFTDKKEILLVQEKILSASLVNKNYYTNSSFKINNKPSHKKNLSTCNINSSRMETVTHDNHDIGRATHFMSKTRRNKLSYTYLEENLSNANTCTKSDFACTNRLTVKYNPTKKRKKVKNPLTHVPYNENNSNYSSDDIEFDHKPSSVNIENFFKTNESVPINYEKNPHDRNKYLHDTEEDKKVEILAIENTPPKQGKESGTVICGYDNIRLVYQNHENGTENVEKPLIRKKVKYEKKFPLETTPNKSNMGYVIEVLDEYQKKEKLVEKIFSDRYSGNESVSNHKRNIVGEKNNNVESNVKLTRDDNKNLKRKYNFRVVISNGDGNQSFDEKRDCCAANERCVMF